METKQIVIKPQDGFQVNFLSCPADIIIGGSGAGVGKTFALLMDPLRYVNIEGFGAVIFRRTTPQIKNEGGLWDQSQDLYSIVGGEPREYTLQWGFRVGNNGESNIRFSHLEYEKNKYDHQGGQYAYIGFDELTQFTRTQFLYLLSRNRSTCGIRPCVRATCNPDPDSWVADFIKWWIGEDGYPIPERIGKLRYFIIDANNFVWGDTKQEVIDRVPHVFKDEQFKDVKPEDLVKSVSFIPGHIQENRALLNADPAYMANLLALPENEQMRLLKGNWKIRQDGLSLFNYLKINDLFTNFVNGGKKYITADVARFGRDLTVIISWDGLKIIKITILTHSKTNEVVDAIEIERERLQIGKSEVAVDEGGVGGGVVDQGGYLGFVSNASVMENPDTKKKENYSNLKTQCYYYLADKVNLGELAIGNNFVVNGKPSVDIVLNGQIYTIEKLIKEDLRSIKRKASIKDEKLQINSKDEQKNILSGRSPDFGDSMSMRMIFNFVPKKKPSFSFGDETY
jgi:hypothetical protein